MTDSMNAHDRTYLEALWDAYQDSVVTAQDAGRTVYGVSTHDDPTGREEAWLGEYCDPTPGNGFATVTNGTQRSSLEAALRDAIALNRTGAGR